jgi:hypothetical protein
MTASHIAGPSIVFGATLNQLGTGGSGSAGSNPEAGPSATYQGDCILDPRTTYQPGVTGRGKVFGFLDSPYIMMADGTPAAYGAAKIAAAQTATSGTPLTLASATAPGINPNTPIVPQGSSYIAANVVKALGLDVGFGTCTTVAGSTTVTAVTRPSILAPGICVMIAGGVSGAWIAATVLSVTQVSVSSYTLTLDTAMGASLTGAAIALANGSGVNSAGALAFPPVAVFPWLTAGALAVFDGTQGIARGVSVTSNNAGDTGWTVTVAGYDVFGVPMHETISVAANSTAYGWKAFKYITSVTPTKNGSTAGTFSIGTSDLFGFSLRSDYWESMNVFWNGSYLTASTGWTAGDQTTPATATTHDVRGTFQVSGIGPNGSGGSATPSNGSIRMTLYQTLHPYNLFGATPQNPAPLFGPTQY